MPDYARWQTPEYIEANYEPEPPAEPRSMAPDDPIALAVRKAYLDARLMHGCDKCPGAFWQEDERDAHAARCGR